MYTKTILSILSGAAICVVPLCAQTGAVSKGDAEFLKIAAEADMTTTHIGKMAEDRATADGVKDFGKKLAQDHPSDYNKLCEFAAKTHGFHSMSTAADTRLKIFDSSTR